MTLTEFLEARIEEDEAAAHAATTGPWIFENMPNGFAPMVVGHEMVVAETYDKPHLSDARHIARHNPARVLAECQAKRNLVRYAAFMLKAWEDKPEGAYPDMNRRERHTARLILETLAAVHADHPDYRAERGALARATERGESLPEVIRRYLKRYTH